MSADYDTQVLPFANLASLLRGAPWCRVAVLGDSIAEGVREPHAGFSDLSWIDRITDALRAASPGVSVMNLGQRGLLASEVRERQLVSAVAFRPDLAIVAAGGNDALHPAFDEAAVEREVDGIVAPLRNAGADVLMIELMDIVSAGLVPPVADVPLAALAALTRRVAARRGAILVPMRHHAASADPDVYASDRLHLNVRGHAIVGTEAVRALSHAITDRRAVA
jgi:lysophospholipase L1-like esterase